MQCRQPSLEGTGEIPLRRLVKEALRMRPSRIIVGEVRQAESLDLLIALNSGLPGMCTIHANSAREAVTKMCTLPLLAGENVGSRFVVPTVAGSIDLVVHVGARARRASAGSARSSPCPGRVEGDVVEIADLFVQRDGELRPRRRLPAAPRPVRAGRVRRRGPAGAGAARCGDRLLGLLLGHRACSASGGRCWPRAERRRRAPAGRAC